MSVVPRDGLSPHWHSGRSSSARGGDDSRGLAQWPFLQWTVGRFLYNFHSGTCHLSWRLPLSWHLWGHQEFPPHSISLWWGHGAEMLTHSLLTWIFWQGFHQLQMICCSSTSCTSSSVGRFPSLSLTGCCGVELKTLSSTQFSRLRRCSKCSFLLRVLTASRSLIRSPPFFGLKGVGPWVLGP